MLYFLFLFNDTADSAYKDHCIKFLHNYHRNNLNLTMNYTVYAANCCKH